MWRVVTVRMSVEICGGFQLHFGEPEATLSAPMRKAQSLLEMRHATQSTHNCPHIQIDPPFAAGTLGSYWFILVQLHCSLAHMVTYVTIIGSISE